MSMERLLLPLKKKIRISDNMSAPVNMLFTGFLCFITPEIISLPGFSGSSKLYKRITYRTEID